MSRRLWRKGRPLLDEIFPLEVANNATQAPLCCVLGDVSCHEIVGPTEDAQNDPHVERSPLSRDPDFY